MQMLETFFERSFFEEGNNNADKYVFGLEVVLYGSRVYVCRTVSYQIPLLSALQSIIVR